MVFPQVSSNYLFKVNNLDILHNTSKNPRLKNLNKLGLMQITSYYTTDLIAGLKLTIIQL